MSNFLHDDDDVKAIAIPRFFPKTAEMKTGKDVQVHINLGTCIRLNQRTQGPQNVFVDSIKLCDV